MPRKFIPDGDSDFAHMARNFSNRIAEDAALYHLSDAEAQEIVAKVTAFRDAMAANYTPMTRCKATVMRKDKARAEAERAIRDVANRIRADRTIAAVDKLVIRVKERPARLRSRECPQTPPVMMFVRSTTAFNSTEGKHIIKFIDDYAKQSLAKPEGAVRLELFVDLVPPGEPIPKWPGQRWGGRMWYLRFYTRSPMVVDYPRTDEPMRVVYWAHWAAASGETGPFSQTLAARVEGFDRPLPSLPGQARQSVIITTIRGHLPALGEVTQASSDQGAKLLGSNIADAA